MPQGSLRVPDHRVDRGKGEWDWYYTLDGKLRKRLLRFCRRGGIGPDECAAYSGFEYVDQWADALVAALKAPRDTKSEPAPFAQMLAADELVGPVEVAAMLDVAPNTVHVWAKRGVLPAPWATISATRLWSRWEILEWADETGRALCAAEVF